MAYVNTHVLKFQAGTIYSSWEVFEETVFKNNKVVIQHEVGLIDTNMNPTMCDMSKQKEC